MKGLAISNSELIRTVHNSFSRSDPFVNEIVDPNAGKDQDVYHFIAYTPIHGALYELDGLSRGPVNLGACNDNNWVNLANEAIQRRMEGYGASELHFSLMALTKDKLELYEEQIEELDGLLLSLSEDATAERNKLNHERSELEHKLQLEKDKRGRWHVSGTIHTTVGPQVIDPLFLFTILQRENVLRKHNFIPIIYNLLKGLAERDQLDPLVVAAREKAKNRSKQ